MWQIIVTLPNSLQEDNLILLWWTSQKTKTEQNRMEQNSIEWNRTEQKPTKVTAVSRWLLWCWWWVTGPKHCKDDSSCLHPLFPAALQQASLHTVHSISKDLVCIPRLNHFMSLGCFYFYCLKEGETILSLSNVFLTSFLLMKGYWFRCVWANLWIYCWLRSSSASLK